MNQVFIRSDQLADKIHDVKLLMPEWKVLFALDGKMATDEIAAFLEISPDQIEKFVMRLQDLGLVRESGAATQDISEPAEEAVTEFPGGEPELTFPESPETDDISPELTEESAAPDFMEESPESEEPAESGELLESQDMSETATNEKEVTGTTLVEPEEEAVTEETEEEPSEEMPVEEHLEELKLEEETVASEEETEEDLDSLINDLLKEEVAPEEAGEETKMPAEEMGDIETEIDLPQETPESEEVTMEPETEEREPDLDFDVGPAETEVTEQTEEISEETEAPEVPVAEPEVEETEDEGLAPAPGEGHKTILVVDDSIVIRKMVEIALENESYEVVSVANGKDAFSYLDSKNPDLVILDIMLPDVNGLDILKAIKASKKIPVVMLSAKDTPKETSQAKDLGADDFIPKPFRDEELVSKIHELIGQ